MERGHARAIERYPRPNQEHRGGDCPEDVGKKGAHEKEERVQRGRSVAPHLKMNSGSDDEEPANHDDEAPVLAAGMHGPPRGMEAENIISDCDRREPRADFRGMAMPFFPGQHGGERDRQEERRKREHAERVWFGMNARHASESRFAIRQRKGKTIFRLTNPLGERQVSFNDSAGLLSGQAGPKKSAFFCCLKCGDFRRIAGNQVWAGGHPDIVSAGSVQKILKKN